MARLKEITGKLTRHYMENMTETEKISVRKPCIFGLLGFFLCMFLGIVIKVGISSFFVGGISLLGGFSVSIYRIYQNLRGKHITFFARCIAVRSSFSEKITDNMRISFLILTSKEKEYEGNYFTFSFQQKRNFNENELYEMTFLRKEDVVNTLKSYNLLEYRKVSNGAVSER